MWAKKGSELKLEDKARAPIGGGRAGVERGGVRGELGSCSECLLKVCVGDARRSAVDALLDSQEVGG